MSHVPKGNVIPLSALEWLPTDAEEQLSLAFRIIGNAYKSKVSTLDAENRQLRSQLDELKNQISNFQKKQSATEVELIDARQRINNYKDENIQLLAALRKLQEKIERFENVRKAVLSSIQDHTGIEEDDKYLLSEAYLGACAPLTYQDITHDVSKDPFTRYTRDTVQAYHVPAQNGTTTASPANQTNSYGAHSATTNSSALMSPAHTQHGQLNTPQTNDTQLTSGGGAEGKHFFRLVKQRIEYDRFQAFIAMVRRLNTKQQTREETLAQNPAKSGTVHKIIATTSHPIDLVIDDMSYTIRSLINDRLPTKHTQTSAFPFLLKPPTKLYIASYPRPILIRS